MGGARKISGIIFTEHGGDWVSAAGELQFMLTPNPATKCVVIDTRDGCEFSFPSVVGAKTFAKRRRHGRTLEEHIRAETLLWYREASGLDIKGLAKRLGVSPRTIEAYFSGRRVVPEAAMAAIGVGRY